MPNRWLLWLFLVPIAVGCSNGSRVPLPGDDVAPLLVGSLEWEPGDKASVAVRLAATDASGRRRSLGFEASPTKNPVARVDFFDSGGEPIGSEEVKLSHRC